MTDRPVPYERILALDFEAIERRYPNGLRAVPGKAERWRPAGPDERPHKTFRELKAEWKQNRRMRGDSDTYMHRRSQMGYTDNVHLALEKVPTPFPELVKGYATKARENDAVRKAGEHERRLAQPNSIERQITEAIEIAREQGVDVHADIQFIRRRVARMIEKLQKAS